MQANLLASAVRSRLCETGRLARAGTIDVSAAVVADSFQTTPGEIQQPGRHGNLAREVAIWLCRQTVRVPLAQIASAFGGVSAGTITDTIRRCEARQKKSRDFQQTCESLRGRVYDFSELAEHSRSSVQSTLAANSEKS